MKRIDEIAGELIHQFKILEKYPRGDGEKVLIETLIECGPSEFQARSFVKGWMRTNRKCPMPCDIYQALEKQVSSIDTLPAVPAGPRPPSYYCNRCEDSGWHMVQSQKWDPNAHEFYMGAKRCEHPLEFRGTKRKL